MIRAADAYALGRVSPSYPPPTRGSTQPRTPPMDWTSSGVTSARHNPFVTMRYAPQPPSPRAIEEGVHRVGSGGLSMAAILGVGLGTAGLLLGYGFALMAAVEIEAPVVSYPFNPTGVSNVARAGALTGFGLTIAVAGLAVGGLVGLGIGSCLDSCRG